MTCPIEAAGDLMLLIERERVRQGLSMQELSLRAGKGASTYFAGLSRKTGNVHLETALRYARVLGLRVSVG